MQANVPYDEVVQFVLPLDTVFSGFTLTYDSIQVVSVNGMPLALNDECNVSNCKYYGNTVDPIRFCLRFSGTPIDTSLGMSGWDSIIVRLLIHVNVPIWSNSFWEDFPIYYRKGQLVGIGIERMPTPELKVNPNPVTDAAWVTFEMQRAGNVHFSLSDAFGREVRKISRSDLAMGNQKILLEIDDLPSGLYFLRVESAEGLTAIQRIVKL